MKKQDIYKWAFGAITSLLLANVRNYLQYGELATESIGYFVGMWLLHYIAILLLALCSVIIYSWMRQKMTFDNEEFKPLDTDDFFLIVFSVVFTASIFVFVIAVVGISALSSDVYY